MYLYSVFFTNFKGNFAIDSTGQRYLLYDSRADNPNDVVFIIWATDEGLIRLRTYHHWRLLWQGNVNYISFNFKLRRNV